MNKKSTKKDAAPFWTAPVGQTPKAFDSFKNTPPTKKSFTVPSLDDRCFADTMESCPCCGSPNIVDCEAPTKGVMEVSCADCQHQWMGIHPFATT